ncbi:hypothetical protein EPN81_03800, partial [Patescibacteria group bacterium]
MIVARMDQNMFSLFLKFTHHVVSISIVGIFLFIPLFANASVGEPSTIGYQGRLKNSSGIAIEGTYDFIFTFYDEASGGTLLATETANDVSVSDGYFSVTLNLEGDIGDFANLVYVQIQVKADASSTYETMTSRVVIQTVPYALFTRAIENATTAPTSDLFEGRVYYNTTSDVFSYYNGSSWTAVANTSSTSLDAAYNNFAATASKLTIDAAQGQTGGLEFESQVVDNIIIDLQSTGDFVVQDAGSTFATFSDSGTITFDGATSTTSTLAVTGVATFSDDIGVNGGDFTSSATTFNLLNTNVATVNFAGAATTLNIVDAASTRTIDIGGVTLNGTTTVNVATNATSADTITIGNSHTSTVVAITGGDDWSISSAGIATFAGNANANGGLDIDDAFVVADGGVLTTSQTANFDGVVDFDGQVDIGDNGDTVSIDSSDWDVSAVGAMTGIASITTDDNQTTLAVNLPVTGTDATIHEISFQIDSVKAIAIAGSGDGAGGVNGPNRSTISIGQNGTNDNIYIGSATADVNITDASWSVNSVGTITTTDDIAINGGDLTTTSTTFNLVNATATTVNLAGAATTLNLRDAAGVATIDIGGVTLNGTTTVNVATHATAADSITIGNTHTSTTVAITGGDDWSISTAGVVAAGLDNTPTTNGLCHSGADIDAGTDTAREVVPCSAAPDDYAEWYETDSDVSFGDLVALS